MEYSKITGIIRAETVESVERRLVREGAPGMSITKVKGFGEYMDFFSRNWLVTHARVEVFAFSKDAERIARAIVEEANCGASGDGIVAIAPVETIFRVRTGKRLSADEH